MLIWLKKKCDNFDEWTFAFAAMHGSLENMIWLKEQGCLWDEDTFTFAVKFGSLKSVKWLNDNGCPMSRRIPFYSSFPVIIKDDISAWLETIGYRKCDDGFIKNWFIK